MADGHTTNLNLPTFEAGSRTNTWATDFATYIMTPLDALFGTSAAISSTGGTVSVTDSQLQSAGLTFTGTLASNLIIQFPASRARLIVIDTSAVVIGAFTITVKENGGSSTTLGVGRYVVWMKGAGAAPALVVGDQSNLVLKNSGSISAAAVTVASASTPDIGAAASHSVSISGSTNITGFATAAAGTLRFVTFQGALTLTYNAVSFQLPGSANITTAANDFSIWMSLGSGNWACLIYYPNTGSPLTASGTSSIANNSVTYAKIQDISATQRFLGRNTAGAGDPEEVTLTQALGWLPAVTAVTSPDVADTLPMYDNSAAAGGKMTFANFLLVLNALTEDTSPVVGSDFLLEYDTSAGAVKKVKPSSFGFATGTIPAGASVAQMRASTAGVYVQPNVFPYHPAANKCWAICALAGTLTNAYGVSSAVLSATGTLDIAMANFLDANYVLNATPYVNSTNNFTIQEHSGFRSASAARLLHFSSVPSLANPSGWQFQTVGNW